MVKTLNDKIQSRMTFTSESDTSQTFHRQKMAMCQLVWCVLGLKLLEMGSPVSYIKEVDFAMLNVNWNVNKDNNLSRFSGCLKDDII